MKYNEAILLAEEEKNYMYILELVKRLEKDVNFLRKNIDNKNVVTNSTIKRTEELIKKTEEEYNTIQDNEFAQKVIYKVYKQGVEPRLKDLKNIVKNWNEKHNKNLNTVLGE